MPPLMPLHWSGIVQNWRIGLLSSFLQHASHFIVYTIILYYHWFSWDALFINIDADIVFIIYAIVAYLRHIDTAFIDISCH